MNHNKPLSWINLYLITFAAAYAYAILEWLFIVTKPSFMDILSGVEKIKMLLQTGALITGIAFSIILVATLLGFLPLLIRFRPWLQKLSSLIPAVIFASLFLMWIDNFTYVLFKFGIVTTQTITKAFYAILFMFLVRWFFRWTINFAQTSPKFLNGKNGIYLLALASSFVALLLITVIVQGSLDNPKIETNSGGNKPKPHILLITSDALSAANLSLYGYDRDTTPNLRQMAPTSLVAENAFANAGHTMGSLTSIYTGKYATTVRVIFPPDILRGSDSYQHLPGILRLLGYRTLQLSVPHYGDAYSVNLLNGFDSANNRSITESALVTVLNKRLPNDLAYFVVEIGNRLFDRLKHIFFIKNMENAYAMVTSPPKSILDQEKIDQTMKEIRYAQQPTFIHLHLLSTHGVYLEPNKRVYSTEASNKIMWDVDSYDDTILEFDTNLGTIIQKLKKWELYDETIIIVGTDHSQKNETVVQIPLVFRFPHGEYAGRIRENVQLIDIAPTLLSYLGQEIPEWMQGQTLLQPISANRPIFGVSVLYPRERKDGDWVINMEKIGPPFYQFGNVSIVYCQQWYVLNLNFPGITGGVIDNNSSACPNDRSITHQQALDLIIDHLKSNGFDTTSLENLAAKEQ